MVPVMLTRYGAPNMQNYPTGQANEVWVCPKVVKQVFPGSQGMQSLIEVDLVFGEYVPRGHKY